MGYASVKYAVALISGDEERILGLFDTLEEADEYGESNPIPRSEGLSVCYSALFSGEMPMGNSISIYGYFNQAEPCAFD